MSEYSLTVQVRTCIELDQLVDMDGTNNIAQFLDGVYQNPPTYEFPPFATYLYTFLHLSSTIYSLSKLQRY